MIKIIFNNGKNFEQDYVKKATTDAIESAGLNVEKTERKIQGNTIEIAFLNSQDEYISESEFTNTEKNTFISEMESQGFYFTKEKTIDGAIR